MINNIAYESTVFISLTNEVVTQTLFTSLATLILIFVMTMNRHGSVTRWSHVAGGPGWRDFVSGRPAEPPLHQSSHGFATSLALQTQKHSHGHSHANPTSYAGSFSCDVIIFQDYKLAILLTF